MTERPVLPAHRRHPDHFAGIFLCLNIGDAGIIFYSHAVRDPHRRRGDEEGYRPAADAEHFPRVPGKSFLHDGDAQHRQRRRHHHERRAECGPCRESRRRDHDEIIEKRQHDQRARVPHGGISLPYVFCADVPVHFPDKRFVEAKRFLCLEIDKENACPIDRHFLEAFHDVRDLVDRLWLRFSHRLQHAVDDEVAQAVADESAGEIRDGQQPQNADSCPLPRRHACLCVRLRPFFFFEKLRFQHPPDEKKQEKHGNQEEDHFPVSRELIADMTQDAFACALLAIPRPVPRRGKKPDESEEYADSPAHHPGSKSAFLPGIKGEAESQYHRRYGQILHRPAAKDAREEHGQSHARAPADVSGHPQIIREQKKESEKARPEVDRGAAFPYGHFAEVGQGEPHKERRQREDARLGGELRIPCGMEIEEDEHAREDRRVGDVEGEFPDPQEEVEEKDRHRPSAVSHVMIFQRLEHIAKRRNMLRRPPDQGIIKIIAPDREQNIQEHHEKEDARKEQKGLPAVFLSRHHHRPSLSPAAPPGPASLHTSFFCRSSRPPSRADGVCSH